MPEVIKWPDVASGEVQLQTCTQVLPTALEARVLPCSCGETQVCELDKLETTLHRVPQLGPLLSWRGKGKTTHW